MTIAEAALSVLKNAGKPLTVQEIYNLIISQNLYSFGAKDAKGVLSQAIRKRSNANPKAKAILFKVVAQGTYTNAD